MSTKSTSTIGEALHEPTLFLTDEDVGKLADCESTISALREAYKLPEDPSTVPPRTMARRKDMWLRSLAAISPSGNYLGSKLIAAAPSVGFASYLISMFDAKTMGLAALIDGNQVTGIRTAATSAVAVDALAPRRKLRLSIIGSGFEAQGQLEAIAAVREIAYVNVYSPSPISRAKFVEKFALLMPSLAVRASESAEQAVQDTDVLVCAARSHDETPVALGQWLRPGMVVVSIGSTLPEQREVDEEIIRKAAVIVADMPEEVMHDTGDMIAATAANVPFSQKVISLSALLSGRHDLRWDQDAITLFKSVGSALQDVVVAEMLIHRARQASIGTALGIGIVPVAKWKTAAPVPQADLTPTAI